MEECRNGMQVLIREGSAAKNLEAIVKGIVEHHTDTSGFCFCTDDKHIEEIRKEGHINFNVRKAVQLGLRPGTGTQDGNNTGSEMLWTASSWCDRTGISGRFCCAG